ncbi:MAG: hypothetical protein M3Q06_00040, partial [Bacteroidota bacterium]|nr:hypothetical protein [Bacteroidota bacterium]
MNRYTVFYRVHKGLRALLFDTSLLLQRTDFTIEEEAGKAINRLRLVIAFLEQYRYWEDKYILPAMHAFEPGIAVEFEQEHENAYQREKKLENLLKDFSATLLPLEKLQWGAAISAQFEAVMQATIRYLSREQSLIDMMLWRYYTDFELQ